MLRFYEDMRLEDIAHITGANLSTVKSRLYTALGRLREALGCDIGQRQGGRRGTGLKSIRAAKAAYEAIRPPDELSAAVREAVRSTRTGTGTHVARWSVMAAAAVCALFVVLVNASPVLANSLYGMPVIGNVARVFTFTQYESWLLYTSRCL